MKVTASQRSAVAVRIEFARGELADLAEYSALDWMTYQQDRKARRNVERMAENIANAVIDVAKILLSASGSDVPATYREVLGALGGAGLAGQGTTEEFVRLAQLRNTLSHRYLDYKWESLKWFLRTGSARVAEWLEQCEAIVTPTDEGEAGS